MGSDEDVTNGALLRQHHQRQLRRQETLKKKEFSGMGTLARQGTVLENDNTNDNNDHNNKTTTTTTIRSSLNGPDWTSHGTPKAGLIANASASASASAIAKMNCLNTRHREDSNTNAVSVYIDPPKLNKSTRLTGKPRDLPRIFLGRGFQSNSYFAGRLRNVSLLLILLDCAGIVVFYKSSSLANGGIHVAHVEQWFRFRYDTCNQNDHECMRQAVEMLSCKTMVAYSLGVYFLAPAVFFLALPSFGFRLGDPFHRANLNDPIRHKVQRSLYMQFCELLSVLVLLACAMMVVYFLYAVVTGTSFNCNLLGVQLFSVGAVVSFALLFVQLTYFTRFREHVKMQLGAIRESDQTGNVRSYFAKKRKFASERDEIEHGIRKELYVAAEFGELREMRRLLAFAQQRLGSDFADDMYKHAKLWLGMFAKSRKNPFHVAAYRGDIAAMQALLDADFDVNSFDKVWRVRFSTGDLFWAFVQLLVARPAVTAEENAASLLKTTLVTPLHCAVSTGSIEAVRWLIDNGADVNLKSKSSFWSEQLPPLFVADHPEIVRLLLEAGANHLEVPDPGHKNTLTALQLAYLRGNFAVAEELEEWGGDVALTPLHTACGSNDVVALQKLLKSGADPNCVGEHGYCGMHRRTPLHWGAINGADSAVMELLGCGADPNFQDARGRTPLHWAARVNRPEVVRILLLHGADPHIRDEDSMTPILCAAFCAHASKDLFQHLVGNGAHINDQLDNGDTPLHIAMKNELQETALALVEKGASITMVNKDGQRPLDCTSSTKLQFEIKRAAGNRDVMISYTHSHAEFALKLRKSLEEANITTWVDLMDPSGIGGGAVWREEIARGIKNAALVLCILTEDYPKSEWCLKELALAKEAGKPIMAVSTEHVIPNEELQVYLYTRQIIPFEPAITSINKYNPKQIKYQYDVEMYPSQFCLLLDGVRDEIEKQRAAAARKWALATSRQLKNPLQLTSSSGFSRRLHHRSRRSSLRSSVLMASMTEADVIAPPQGFVFISHGDAHFSFAKRICEQFAKNGIRYYLDGLDQQDMSTRIRISKEAIRNCSCFLVILSRKTSKNELVKDQLAFAEDKKRQILPILLNDMELGLDKHYSLSRAELFHFATCMGFNNSVNHLIDGVRRHMPLSAASTLSRGHFARQFGPGVALQDFESRFTSFEF